MSVVSYPKARFLQIILDPRMILNDGQIIIKCADCTFQEVREHLVEELGKRLTNKEMLMMLKSFVNQLLDNNEVMHIHVGYNTCENSKIKKISNLNLLYKKCEQLGLQYGFLNLFPAQTLKKISRSRHKIVEQILNKVNHADEFKEILHLLSIDNQSGVNVVIIVSHMLDSQNSIFRYVMSLPQAVIEIIIDYMSLTSHKIEYSRISELLNLYNKKQDLFISVKKNLF